MSSPRGRSILITAAVGASVSLIGCGAIGALWRHADDSIECGVERKFAPRNDQIGSVRVSVAAVADWNKYKLALTPDFKLTAEGALAKVLQTTQTLDERLVDAVGGRLRVALDEVAVTSSRTDSGGNLADDSRTRTRTPGDVADAVVEDTLANDRLAKDLPSALPADSKIDVNPMTKYLAANALFQEVQLINRAIEDAAVRGRNVRPYVVRLQVSVSPIARNLPYDCYTSVSFFDKARVDQAREGQRKGKDKDTVPSEARRIQVIPLLVTDEIEALLHGSSTERLRDFAAAISGAVPALSATASLQRVLDEMRSVLGRDLNNLFLVSRLSENTIQCRFGARNDPSAGFELNSQTHFVTVVLLVDEVKAVDKEGRELWMAASSDFRHAIHGFSASPTAREDTYREQEAVLDNAGYRETEFVASRAFKNYETAQRALFYSVMDNDLGGFVKILNAGWPNPPAGRTRSRYFEGLFNEIAKNRTGRQIDNMRFTLPAIDTREPSLPPSQALVAFDDEKSALTVTVREGVKLDGMKSIGAELLVHKNDCDMIRIRATGARIVEGRDLVLTFPSMRALAKASNRAVDVALPMQVAITAPGLRREYALLLAGAPPEAKAGFTLATNARTIAATRSAGRIDLFVRGGDPKQQATAVLTVSGATIDTLAIVEVDKVTVVDATNEKVTRDGATIRVKGGAHLRLTLSNLFPDIPFVVEAFDDGIDGKPRVPALSLVVREIAESDDDCEK